MGFKRKKLLNSLLLTALCTTLIPLIVAGLYLIPKTGFEIKKASQEKLLSYTIIMSHFLESQFFLPVQFFLRDLALKTSVPSEIQFNLILQDHASLKTYLNSISESFSDSSQKIWYVINDNKIEPTFRPDGFVPFTDQDPVFSSQSFQFSHENRTKYLWLGLKTRKNSTVFAIIEISRVLRSFNTFASSQNFDSNFGIINLEDKEVLTYRYLNSKNSQPPNYNNILFERKETNSNFYEYRHFELGDHFGAYSDVNSFSNWRIVAELPGSVTKNSIKNLWFNFSILMILGFIFVLLGTIYYGKRITKPLERFARSATEIARGNFNQRVQLESDDEIGRLAKIFNYMVIELDRLNKMNLNKIITERTKTKTIIKNIGDGIIVTDEEDKIVLINVAVEKWFRIQEDKVVDQPVQNVMIKSDLLKLFEEIKESELEGTFTRELPIFLPGQTKEKIFQTRATKISNQKGEYVGIVAIFRDITKETEIDRMKTELVSMVAHELRSPLTSISGFAELLLSDGESTEDVQEYANIIRDEANRLANLVNKFLDITKIEAGRMDYIPTLIPIKEILDDTLHIAVIQAQKKNIKISVNLPDEEMAIYADNKLICEVILNLLSNAIKYSPEKTHVNVLIEEDTEMMNISIVDQGYGIAQKHLQNVFKKFYRIKEDLSNTDERGTGLGLALVKEIVELHNGQVNVESIAGSGSTFTIRLPKQKHRPDGNFN